MVDRTRTLLLLPLLACAEVEEEPVKEESAVLDLRVDFPEPADGVQFLTPDLEIDPYEEVMYCYYDAYEGPEAGIVGMLPLFSKAYGHHVFLKDTKDWDDTPTGTLLDCTSGELVEMQESVFVQSVQNFYPNGTGDWLSLLPGYAFHLEENQQFKLDVHFINATEEALLANAAVNLELVPAEEVHTWVGGFDLDLVHFEIPPGEDTSISFDCPLPTGSSVISLGGHMHEHGLSYRVDLVRGEDLRPILQIDDWSEEYRYSAPMEMFWPGDVLIEEGDLLRTTCTWSNYEQQSLSYPDEMCTTFGVATGLTSGLLCQNGDIVEDGQ